MFTMRQIALAGFLGVYAGCMPLTVNMARLPYWRGAVIGVFFGALTHMMTTLIYVLVTIYATSIMDDPILKRPESWVFIAICIFVVQALSSVGCQIMGAYFNGPVKGTDTFDRNSLYQRLKAHEIKVNPPDATFVRKSVMHDVVVSLESNPAPEEKRFSWLWILLFGVLSIAASLIWINTLFWACIDALYFGVPVDGYWYLNIVLNSLFPLIILILTHFSTIGWLCRDVPRRPIKSAS